MILIENNAYHIVLSAIIIHRMGIILFNMFSSSFRWCSLLSSAMVYKSREMTPKAAAELLSLGDGSSGSGWSVADVRRAFKKRALEAMYFEAGMILLWFIDDISIVNGIITMVYR